MVKRILALLLLLLLIASPGFALDPRIVDQGDFLTQEEVEQLNIFMDALEQVFDMETAAFLMDAADTPEESFTDELHTRFPLTKERWVYFAYNHQTLEYFAESRNIPSLSTEKLTDILNELAEIDYSSAFLLINDFYRKVYDLLLPTLGDRGNTSTSALNLLEEGLFENVILEDEGLLWSAEEKTQIRQRAEELAKENILIFIATTDKNPDMSTQELLQKKLADAPGSPDRLGILFDMDQMWIELRVLGRVEELISETQLQEIADAVASAPSRYEGIKVFLDRAEDYLKGEMTLSVPPASPVDIGKVFLEDLAGLWSEEEKAALLTQAQALSQKHDLRVALATTADSGSKSSEAYIDDICDAAFGIDTDNVGFLIDMDKRIIHISTSGKAIDYLDDKRIETMLDHAFEDVSASAHFLAAQGFLEDTDQYFVAGIDPNYKGRKERDEPNNLSPLDVLAGLGVGGTGGLGFFTRTKKKYARKALPLSFRYHDQLIGGLVPVQGELLNRRTTSRTISSSSGSSGGSSSSTHSSSSGGTHGGGGRSF